MTALVACMPHGSLSRSFTSRLLLVCCLFISHMRTSGSHFSTRGTGPFRCANAADARINCTRCAPGWRGTACDAAVFVAPCTPAHCLDWSRCPWGAPLTLHVYDTPAGPDAAYVDSRASAVWRDVVTTLRASKRHVANDACLHVPWFDTLCTGNECTSPSHDVPKTEWLISAVEVLPHWNGNGANHLLFDMSSNHAPRLPVGRGFYAATSFWAAGRSFRHGHDVALPLWNQRWEEYLSPAASTARRAGNRSRLLVFKGQRMFFCKSCAPLDLAAALSGSLGPGDKPGSMPHALKHGWVRNQLHLLHNGRDVWTVGTCSRELQRNDLGSCDADCRARCAQDSRVSNGTNYDALLWDAVFGLVLPGITPMSYRLAETMATGAVPVIASDYMTLPFSSVLDWEKLVVRVPETSLHAVPEQLRNLPHEKVIAMRMAVANAYERCFSTPGKIALCAVDQLEANIFGRLLY